MGSEKTPPKEVALEFSRRHLFTLDILALTARLFVSRKYPNTVVVLLAIAHCATQSSVSIIGHQHNVILGMS
jgi:hypothetical protein